MTGTKTRFRSLELSGTGDSRNSLSGRGNGNINPSEGSPVALYQRLFGAGFKDPNSAGFTPDPKVMARRSVLSAVTDQRKALDARVGAADKQKLEAHLEAIRDIERRLGQGGTIGGACQQPVLGAPIDHLDVANFPEIARLQIDLLAMALACDLTRVGSIMFARANNYMTFPWLGGVEGGRSPTGGTGWAPGYVPGADRPLSGMVRAGRSDVRINPTEPSAHQLHRRPRAERTAPRPVVPPSGLDGWTIRSTAPFASPWPRARPRVD